MNLTICYITARAEPRFDWFLDSLKPQVKEGDDIEIIIVDLLRDSREPIDYRGFNVRHVEPKPTLWQGKHRIMPEDWWAISNARNTGFCLAKHDWIAFSDDRCVLAPTWLGAVRRAILGKYAVAGSYEKRRSMSVRNGKIESLGDLDGMDPRISKKNRVIPAVEWLYNWWFGCTHALPVEWGLSINGYPEDFCDGLGFEDMIFGSILRNSGLSLAFDPMMKIFEDRTPSACEGMPKRTDKGKSPNDKSHAIRNMFDGARDSKNSFNLRSVRDAVQSGNPFPPPSAQKTDWYDGQPLPEMVVT